MGRVGIRGGREGEQFGGVESEFDKNQDDEGEV
jgi:hypothetical protein